MNFWKSAKGGEVIFNPKIYIADFGNFKQGFLIMKLIQNSNFRVQGMLFSSIIVLYYNSITPIYTGYIWKHMCIQFILYSHHISLCIYATISVIKKLQYNCPKMRGGGVEGRLEFFQKIIRLGSRILPYGKDVHVRDALIKKII